MTDRKIKQSIFIMRQQGASFTEIADSLLLSPNTVKSICYRNNVQTLPLAGTESDVCRNCGRPLEQLSRAKQKKFCCNQCRYTWWNQFRSRKPYRLICYCCGKEFISFGNKKKKFCGRECYRLSRYGEGLP